MCTHTHLKKLVGLLSEQPVCDAQSVWSIGLVELAQQFGKVSVDVLIIHRLQALQTQKKNNNSYLT